MPAKLRQTEEFAKQKDKRKSKPQILKIKNKVEIHFGGSENIFDFS